MFGTAASFAGIQNRLNASMRNWATNSHTRLSTSGIDANRVNRMMSVITIVLRRSNRSAKAPASGPSTIAGSRRKSSTPPRAKLAAANPSTRDVAVAVIARNPNQSPKLDSDIDSQSLRKSLTRSTARSLAPRPTAPRTSGWASSSAWTWSAAGPRGPAGAPGSSSVSGGAASGGTGVPAGGRPSAGRLVRASTASSGDGAGGVGSDGIGAPGVGGRVRKRSLGRLTVPGRADEFGRFRSGRGNAGPSYREVGGP